MSCISQNHLKLTLIMITSIVCINFTTSIVRGLVINLCRPNPCKNNAECVVISPYNMPTLSTGDTNRSVNHYFCVCPVGWTGENCTVDVDDCTVKPCKNGGRCEDRPNVRYHCACPDGFVGQNCEHINPCTKHPCSNQAVCRSDPLGRFQCICPKWYKGVKCEIEINPCYPTSPCKGKGSRCHIITKPNATGNKSSHIVDFVCRCAAGYSGRYCDAKINLSTSSDCKENVNCLIKQAAWLNQSVFMHPHSNLINIERCSRIGCDRLTSADGLCDSLCLDNNCLTETEAHDCQFWLKCANRMQRFHRVNGSNCLEMFHDGNCSSFCKHSDCYFDGFDCEKTGKTHCDSYTGCSKVYGDGECNAQCANQHCGYDGGDCVPARMGAILNDHIFTKYYLMKLNTSRAQLVASRPRFLSNFGFILNAIVAISVEHKTQKELLEETPNGKELIVIVKFALPQNEYGQCNNYIHAPNTLKVAQQVTSREGCQHPLIVYTPYELENYIYAAISTKQFQSSIPINYLVSVDSPSPSYLKDNWHQGKTSSSVRANEAMLLYITLCITSAAIFLLIIILIFRREHSRRSVKRVKTVSVWCPPAVNYLKTRRSDNAYHNMNNVIKKETCGEVNTKQLLLNLSNQKVQDENYDQCKPIYKSELADYSKVLNCNTPLKLHSRVLQNYHLQNRNFLDQCPCSNSIKEQDVKADSHKEKILDTFLSLDGLHPCSVDDVKRIEVALKEYHSGPNTVESACFNINAIDDDKHIAANELMLHTAARMNVGHKALSTLYENDLTATSVTKGGCFTQANSLSLDTTTRSALSCAAASNALETVQFLHQLEREANLKEKYTKSNKSCKSDLSSPNRHQRRHNPTVEYRQCTPLIAAVQGGNESLAICLLDDGYSYTGIDEYGRNIVHWAALTNSLSLLKRLSRSKGFIRLLNAKDDWERTPLMLAVREGCLEMVEFLLSKNAKVGAVDCMEMDCVKLCQERGYTQINKLLNKFIQSDDQSVKQVTEKRDQEDWFDELLHGRSNTNDNIVVVDDDDDDANNSNSKNNNNNNDNNNNNNKYYNDG